MRRKLALLFLALCLALPRGASASPRLVSTSPGLTEWLFQLGKGEDLVATSIMSRYPPAAQKLPVIGSQIALGAERIVRFRPDWVLFDSAAFNPDLARALHVLGIRVMEIHITDLDHLVSESRRMLATIYGETHSARLTRYEKCLEKLPPARKPFRFLAFAWLSPPILFGQNTFLSHLLVRLGGISPLPGEWKVEYPQVSEEWLLLHQPDLVFLTPEDPGSVEVAKREARRRWPDREVPVRVLSPDHFARPTFTPLLHLGEISGQADFSSLKECLESAL